MTVLPVFLLFLFIKKYLLNAHYLLALGYNHLKEIQVCCPYGVEILLIGDK